MAKPTTIGIETGNSDLPNGSEGTAVIVDDDSGNVIPVVEPATIVGEPDPADASPRKRGRPRGSRNAATTAKQTKQTGSDLTALLMSLHMMGSALLKIDELELDETEARKLGEAIARVNALYDVPILSEKQMAWVNLATTGCAVYGPRLMAYKLRMKTETGKKPVTIDAQSVPVQQRPM